MRIKALGNLLFFIVSSTVIAQQRVIDSLELQLKNPTNGLSEVEILNELSWYYYAQSNSETGIKMADRAISKAIELNDSLQLGLGYERKGLNYQKQGKDSTALSLYDVASNIYKKINNGRRRLATLNYNLGFFHMKRANYIESIEKSNIALEVFTTNRDTLKIARTLNQIGVSQLYLGNYAQAQESFNNGLLLIESIGKDKTYFYAEILSNEGLLQEKLSHFETALKLQKRALKIHEDNENMSGIASTQNNIGKLLSILGNKEEALVYYKKSYEIKKQIGNEYRIANALSNLGILYSELKRNGEALKTLNEAKGIYNALNHETNLSTVHKGIGEIYLESNELKLAERHFDSALTFAKNAKDKRAIYLAKNDLSKVAFKKTDYKSAYVLSKESDSIKETVLSDENRDEIANLKAKYEYEKEKAILEADFEKGKAIDQAKIKRQVLIRNLAIFGGILGIVILWFGFNLVRRKKESDLNAKIATSQLQTLKAQMNPHFIFNSLNSINDFVKKNKKEEASRYLTRFSAMMRKILTNSKEEEVSLDDEIKFLEAYIKLEQQRLKNSFEFEIKVDEKINTEDTLIPPSVLQPFIENSIWHGLSEKENGHLMVTFIKKQDNLLCIIDDNGLGIKPKKNNHESVGIGNAQDRLSLVNSLKGTDAKIELIEKNEGVRVEIQLPLSLKF